MSMEITEEQVHWAYRLFNSLAPHGRWTLPGVGVYERTGDRTLTFVEMFTSRPRPDSMVSIWDQHDFIVALANSLDWEVQVNIVSAYDIDHNPLNIPEDRIGDVAVCSKKCGTIVRIEPPEPGVVLHKIENKKCPICDKVGFNKEWDGLHVYVDSRGAALRQEREMDRREEE